MKAIRYAVLLVLVSMIFVSCSGGVSSDKASVGAVPIVVKIGRDNCIPCIEMNKILESVGDQMGDKVDIRVIDVRDDPDAASKYGIRVIPTTIFYDISGNERYRFEGVVQREDVVSYISECGVGK
ncbi:MAG TPA: thioredoxin family protein [Caldisericia bacterium]|nr:thioredoxin family protein [Caldisericia bacterium]HPF48565.1 thioredoxin family protein [Caldisericia bacterium]HPI83775.1 thioredoxin family protein [Caldisericia bacterium]HPQ93020.1 thioredoxin family protein [Caldisericia bacterium]HRV75147.1 thioredoxin family protein [Caldisericia bacterium]